METLIVPNSVHLFRYRLDRWQIPQKTRIVLHKELEISMLFAEMTAPETTDERRAELDKQIKYELVKIGRHRKTRKKKKTRASATAKNK